MEESKENSQESSSLFNLTMEGFIGLESTGLDLNLLFLLECFNEGTDPTIHSKSERVLGWKQTLIRKGYLTDKGEVTCVGKAVLLAPRIRVPVKPLIRETIIKQVSDFDKWWNAYPRTDLFTHMGKDFHGSRGMRVHKDKCKKEFMKVIDSGEFSTEDMIRALEYEVEMRKNDSVRSGDNKLKFMHNSHTYLLQRDFENFMEISKIVKKKNDPYTGTFNI